MAAVDDVDVEALLEAPYRKDKVEVRYSKKKVPRILCGVMQSFSTRLFCLKKKMCIFFTSLLTSIGVTYLQWAMGK